MFIFIEEVSDSEGTKIPITHHVKRIHFHGPTEKNANVSVWESEHPLAKDQGVLGMIGHEGQFVESHVLPMCHTLFDGYVPPEDHESSLLWFGSASGLISIYGVGHRGFSHVVQVERDQEYQNHLREALFNRPLYTSLRHQARVALEGRAPAAIHELPGDAYEVLDRLVDKAFDHAIIDMDANDPRLPMFIQTVARMKMCEPKRSRNGQPETKWVITSANHKDWPVPAFCNEVPGMLVYDSLGWRYHKTCPLYLMEGVAQ